jgi:pimeloyl-ACP methyl ester carboxylesterase
MELTVNGHRTYCYTGGKAFDPAKPTVVFLHGVLNDHSVWGLQTRYLANHGWNVLAPDLPGHCRSAGERAGQRRGSSSLRRALLDAAGVQRRAGRAQLGIAHRARSRQPAEGARDPPVWWARRSR